MDFKLVLLLALCCTLIAAKSVDRLDAETEEPPQFRKEVKRDDHYAVYNVDDKEGKDVYPVQNKGDGLKLSPVKKRSDDEDEKTKSGCCG